MWKKQLVCLLVVSLLSTVCLYPLQAAVISFDELPRMERFIFGTQHPTMPLKARIEGIEKALLGEVMDGSLLERYRKLWRVIFSREEGPGLFMTASIIEWSLTGQVTERALSERLADIERAVLGQQAEGAFLNRLEELMELTFPEGELELAKTALPPGTVVRVRILEPIDSGVNNAGDIIPYQVAEDVIIDGNLVIPAGTRGEIVLEAVEEEEMLGQDAEVKMVFGPVEPLDGSKEVHLVLDKKAREWNDNLDSLKYVAGASILGTVLLGPIGLLAGFLVKGKPVNMPAGTEFYLETPAEPYELWGLVVAGSR